MADNFDTFANPAQLAATDRTANVDTEKAMLGALLVDIKEGVPLALDTKLKADDFYVEAHALIYAAILYLWDKNQKVDYVTVNDELKKRGQDVKCGGLDYLIELFDKSGAPAHVADYSKSISERSQIRQLMRICAEISDQCKNNNGDVQAIIDQAEAKIFALRESRDSGQMVFLPDAVQGVYSQVAALFGDGQGTGISGQPTGYDWLDHLTGGFQTSDLIVLGGRPGMGKTSFALNLALNAALPFRRQTRSELPPYTVAIFSLEMGVEQLVQRFICQLGGYDLLHIRSGRLNENDMQGMKDVIANLTRASIYMDDSSSLTPLELRARCRRLIRRLKDSPNPLKLIIIDYLQLMRPNTKHSTLEQEVREISGALKGLAKELNVTVMALSQLKRPENVGAPSLSDLRDSGAIEQDADIVAFVVRLDVVDPDKPELEGLAELKIKKHRNGPTGVVHLRFHKHSSSFEGTTLVNHSAEY
ncbi:MAG: replicative DNA helicase [Deltaproteobacteria bacterium]|jgi:replicative DNA helicase|nr:replicative DNA helicase [Deltaproteobacteria bacterium]